MMQAETLTKIHNGPLTKKDRAKKAVINPLQIRRELNNRSLYEFIKYFWDQVSNDEFIPNWHLKVFCDELQIVANRVAENKPKLYDIILNVPPGMTKTIVCSIMFPAWCWTRWFWMRFITGSYSGALSLESAEYSRDLVRSDKFSKVYPELGIKDDKDTKSNFKVTKKEFIHLGRQSRLLNGGNRFSTSIGGTLTGYHAHIQIIDDPLDPRRAASEVELKKTNHWMDHTLSTRKTDKKVTPLILVMQRLHEDDPSGHLLKKKGKRIRHICLPGEIKNYRDQVNPIELAENYTDDLLDSVRLGWNELAEMEMDLGQYGYAGQVGQKPTPPGGGMFKIDHFQTVLSMPSDINIIQSVRYWDKAGTDLNEVGGKGKRACFTVGVKMHKIANGKIIISDVKRGKWSSEERERIIRETAEADGTEVEVGVEQEPGSGGKESAQGTIRNLMGFSVYAECPTGDKVYRADPYSVQVNNGNIQLLKGEWNKEFTDEHENFPFSTYKDQVDAASGAFHRLIQKQMVMNLLKKR